jgi:hypothetical protein
VGKAILLSMVTASISFTVTETNIFLSFREWTENKNAIIGELLSCGYCLGHWIAFALVAIYRPQLFQLWWPLDYFFTALIIAWLSAIQWAIMCGLMIKTGR